MIEFKYSATIMGTKLKLYFKGFFADDWTLKLEIQSLREGIPKDWGSKPSKVKKGDKLQGFEYRHPDNKEVCIRVMPGDSNAKHPNSRKPYVRQSVTTKTSIEMEGSSMLNPKHLTFHLQSINSLNFGRLMKKNSQSGKVKDTDMLNDRFRCAIEIFGSDKGRAGMWKCFEDFRKSVNEYYDVANVLFDGEGYLTLKYAKALLAFHEALNEFCAFSEKNDIEDLQVIQESPHFYAVEQKAQDFLNLVAGEGIEPPTHGL